MIKVYLKSVKKVMFESILSMVFVIFESAFEIIVPLMMAHLIDNGLAKNDMNVMARYGLCIIALILGQTICGFLCAVFAVKASTIFAKDLRARIFRKLQTFAFSNIDKFSTGSLVTRSTTDITNVQKSFQMLIRGAIRSFGMIIFSLIFSFSIDKKIASIFAILVPIVICSFVLLSKFAVPIFEKMFDAFDKLNNIMSENIHGIRVVKTFNREDFEFDKMKKTSDGIFDYSVKAEGYVALWEPSMDVFAYTIILVIGWFGSRAIIASGNIPELGLTTGKLMSLLTYGMSMLISLLMISMIYVMLIISSASLKRISEVLVEDTTIKNPENPIYDIKDGSIEFKNVNFKFSNKAKNNVLKNINVKINSGETIGIIGGTGQGKTSFVNLIPRLYDVTDGEVIVSGNNVKQYDLNSLRNNVGIVLQKNILFSGTIASNLRFGNENATEEEMWKAFDIACATEFVKKKEGELNYIVEQGGTNFSGGQKQRLSIARTLLKNPKILIFDDSTSAVDTKTDAIIREGIKKYLPNTTKIIISQRISSISYCDKIIVFENGEIVGFDTHDNLIKNCSIYNEINNLQNSK